MGLRINPDTGQVEDDGLGEPLATQDQAQQVFQQEPIAPSPAMNGAGAMPPQVQVAPPAQPPVPPAPPPMAKDSETRTREIASPQDKAAMKDVAAADQQAIDIAGRQGEVDKKKAEQQAESARVASATAGQFAQQTATTVDQTAAGVAQAKAKFDAESKRLEESKTSDWWDSKSTGQKVVAIIALALGAFGGALSGRGGNGALDQLEKMVEADYKLRLAKLNNAKEGIGVSRQASEDARGDLAIKQAATWNAIGEKAKQDAAQVGTENAAVQAEAIKNFATQKATIHLEDWWKGFNTKATSTSVTGPAAGKATGASQNTIFDLNGNPVGNALRPDEAEKIRAAQAATVALDKTIGEIKQFNSQHGWLSRKGPDASKQADALAARATGYLTAMFATGTLQQSEYERYKSMLQPGVLQGSGGANQVLDTISTGAKESYNARVGSQGVKLPPAGTTPMGGAAPAAQGMRQTRRLRDGRTVTGTMLPDGRFQVD